LVLIPEENQRDLQEIPDNIKNNLNIQPVKWIEQVLEFALAKMRIPLKDAMIEPTNQSITMELNQSIQTH